MPPVFCRETAILKEDQVSTTTKDTNSNKERSNHNKSQYEDLGIMFTGLPGSDQYHNRSHAGAPVLDCLTWKVFGHCARVEYTGVSYSLNSLKVGFIVGYIGDYYGVIERDASSVDYDLHSLALLRLISVLQRVRASCLREAQELVGSQGAKLREGQAQKNTIYLQPRTKPGSADVGF